jgi:hypothetical protein
MNHATLTLLLAAAAATTLSACERMKAGKAESNAAAAEAETPAANDPVASAMSAAPAAIAKDAAIMTVAADGKMTMVREGTNGWTCMPDSPATPGPDPMCMDANAANWAAAWIGHKPPSTGAPGLIYMLEGGTDASNSDPYATKPTEGGDWVKTGPHLMIVGSPEMLKNYPSGGTPDTKSPYVMWAGTPYAHLMIPTG